MDPFDVLGRAVANKSDLALEQAVVTAAAGNVATLTFRGGTVTGVECTGAPVVGKRIWVLIDRSRLLGLVPGAASGGGGGAPTGPAGGDLAGTYPNPTLAVDRVKKTGDTMSGPLAMGTNKITGLANGVAASDAATVGQLPAIPSSLPPSGLAGGDLTGSYPNPQIAAGVIADADVSASAGIAQSKVANLVTDLAAKAPTAHTHTQAQSHNSPDTDTAPTALHHTLGTGANQAAAGNDARFTDARPPSGAAGGDLSGSYPNPQIAAGVIVDADVSGSAAIAQSKISGLAASLTAKQDTAQKGVASGYASLDSGAKVPIAQVPTGTTAATVALGNDSRFTDSRPPSGAAGGDLTGSYPNPQIAAGVIVDADVAAANKDGAPSTPSLRTLGTGANQAAAGNDPRFGSGGGTVEGSVPVGTINAWGGASIPAGWLLCDGTPHNTPALLTLLGSPNTPDLRGRFLLGASASYAAKSVGGAATHVLTEAEIPSHGHQTYTALAGASGSYSYINESSRVTRPGPPSTDSWASTYGSATGGGGAHNNMPPYYVIVYIIKAAETATVPPSGITSGDAAALMDNKVWSTAWGLIARWPAGASISVPANVDTPITGNLNITLQAGRRYRVFANLRAVDAATAAHTTYLSLWNGSTQIGSTQMNWSAQNWYSQVNATWLIDGTGQSLSALHFRGYSSSACNWYLDGLAEGPAQAYVEDVGPVTRGGPPVVAQDWTAADLRYGTEKFYRNRAEFGVGNIPAGPWEAEMWGPQFRIALGAVKAGDWLTVTWSGYAGNVASPIQTFPVLVSDAGVIQQYLNPRDTTFSDWYLEAGTKQFQFSATLPVTGNLSPTNLAIWLLAQSATSTSIGAAGLKFNMSCIHHKRS